MAGTAGRGAHGGDAVVDVEGEAVHNHVVELDAPAHKHIFTLLPLLEHSEAQQHCYCPRYTRMHCLEQLEHFANNAGTTASCGT